MKDVVYVGIGNSDDKLSQQEWHAFIFRINSLCEQVGKVAGAWFSPPVSPFQNACFAVQNIKPAKRAWFRSALEAVAADFRQDFISYAEAEMQFLRPEGTP